MVFKAECRYKKELQQSSNHPGPFQTIGVDLAAGKDRTVVSGKPANDPFLYTGKFEGREVGITEFSRPAVEKPISNGTEPLAIRKFRPGDDIYVRGIFLDDDAIFDKHFTAQEWESFSETFRTKDGLAIKVNKNE